MYCNAGAEEGDIGAAEPVIVEEAEAEPTVAVDTPPVPEPAPVPAPTPEPEPVFQGKITDCLVRLNRCL